MPRTGKAFWLCPVLRPSGSLLRALHGTKVVSTTLQLHRAAAIELSGAWQGPLQVRKGDRLSCLQSYLWLAENGRVVVIVVIIVPHSSIPY